MKIICAFCKTTFAARGRTGRCPMCGHRAGTRRKTRTGKLFAVAVLFLAACVFAVAALRVFAARQRAESLTVSISGVKYTNAGYIVRGNIRNFSDRTHSVPDLVFVLKTETGAVALRAVHLPPSGLIEPMSDMEFEKTIGPRHPNAQKISVQFEGG